MVNMVFLFLVFVICMEEQDLKKKAVNYVIGLISKKEYAVSDIKSKLEKKYDNETIEFVINYCIDKNYISDERYAEAFIRYRVNNFYGPVKIKYELLIKKIQESLIDRIMDEYEIDFVKNARIMLEKKYSIDEISNIKVRSKAYQFLQRRGFTFEQIDKSMINN